MDWRLDDSDRVRIPLRKNFVSELGNSVYPALPVSFRGYTKSRRSVLSGVAVYARGSKISHQSALEYVTVVDSTTHSNPPPSDTIMTILVDNVNNLTTTTRVQTVHRPGPVTVLGVAMDTEPYPVVAGLLIRKAVRPYVIVGCHFFTFRFKYQES